MRAPLVLAGALLALGLPLAAADPLENCQQYPIGVEEACYAAGPTVNAALAQLSASLGCMIGQEPPVGWPACLPGAPTVDPGERLKYCRNPTWDQCLDHALGPLPQ